MNNIFYIIKDRYKVWVGPVSASNPFYPTPQSCGVEVNRTGLWSEEKNVLSPSNDMHLFIIPFLPKENL